MKGHEGVVRGLAVLPGSKQVVTAGNDKTIRIWDLAAGKETANMTAPDPLHAIALSPNDGTRLLSGDMAGNVRTLEPQ